MSGILSAIPVIGQFLNKTSSIIEKAVPDKDKAKELQHELEMAALQMDVTVLQEQSAVIQSEAKGESFLQRNWRPITMLVFVFIIANNYIICPYANMFYSEFPILPVPEQLWNILTLGIGGYIAGRSVEKTAGQVAQVLKKK